jgi:hypothetical protein
MNWKSSGKLVYSPKTHLRNADRWLILQCDEQLAAYYRALYRQEWFYRPKLIRPVWGSHISVLRGEKIPNADLWGLGANSIIQFEYEPGVKSNGEYYWLTVHCEELKGVRLAYGLSPEPQFGFHLTIARIS